MKPIRLSIAGLHSFREPQEIDFNALTEMGLFGIFGPTGSGKSTILDAITLALYGDVGRAGRNTQAILNHAEKRLEVVFEFDIGSAGRRKRYRVERAYKRGNGFSVEHQTSRLLQLEVVDGDDDYGVIVVADTKNAVNQAIKSILGLEESDFTRAVVLPQGKFAEFLQLTGSDRNAMTERLFGLERYGRSLLEKVNTRARQAAEDLRTIVSNQLELGDASEEAVQAAEAAVQEAERQLSAAERVRREALARLHEAEQVHSLMTEREQALVERDELAARANEVDRWRKSITRSGQAHAVWPLVQAWREAETGVERARQTLRAAESALEQARSTLAKAVQQQEQADAKRAAMEPELLQKQGRLKDAQELEKQLLQMQGELAQVETGHAAAVKARDAAILQRDELGRQVERLKSARLAAQTQLTKHAVSPETRQRIGQLRAAFDAWTACVEGETKARAAYEERAASFQAAESDVRRAAEAFEALLAEHTTLTRKLNDLAAQAPRCTEEDLRELRTWKLRVEPRVQALQAADRDLAEVESRRERAAAVCERQRTVTEARRAAAERQQQVFRDLDEERRRRADLSEHALIVVIAERLQNGMPCPVCGSLHHPAPAQVDGLALPDEIRWSSDDEAALRQAEVAWREAEAALQLAEREAGQHETALRMLDEEAGRKRAHRDSAIEALAACWPPATGPLASSGLPVPHGLMDGASIPESAEAWESFLDRLETALAEAEEALRDWIDQQHRLAEQEAQLKARVQQAEQALALACAAAKTAETEADRQRRTADAAAAEVETAALALKLSLIHI